MASVLIEWLNSRPLSVVGTPRYIQLANIIEQAIKENVLAVGEFLPAERVLAEQLNLSRVTISKAMQLLQDKNLILRQQGIGTRIAGRLGYSLNNAGLTVQIISQGGKISNQWLLRSKQKADVYIAQKLAIEVGETVNYLRRVRLVNNCPVSLENTYIANYHMPEPQLFEGSLHQFWLDKGMRLEKNHYSIKAISSAQDVAKLLDIQKQSPLLQVLQTSRNQYGEIVEFSEALCRSDVYQFEIEL